MAPRPDQVRCAAVVHHQSPGCQDRIGWFFAAEAGWTGEPVDREPAKHIVLVWIDPTAPPATPAQEAGAFLGREIYRDSGEVCLDCLANRGTLGLMYCREFDG